MKKFLIVMLLSITPLYFLTISGCESTSSVKNGDGVIRGIIQDSTSSSNLDSVIISTTPATKTVMTTSTGAFLISGVSDGTYTVTARKPGYFTRTVTAVVLDADTATANAKMRFTGVYTYNGLTVQENNAIYTNLSAVNLYNGVVINEFTANDPNKDIQMRNSYDSLGASIDFYLRSGDLAKVRAGSQTFFGAPLTNPKTGLQTFTKAEFDTLSSIYDFTGNLNTYFTENATATFNYFPDGSNAVYPFFLAGRNAATPGVIGVIYLRNSYFGVGNYFYVVIDVKVNRLGYNIFNGNQ
ncbi:MAG: carboxypeptidase-like regulatory domain-containing protein [Ignavibacteriota bacterium]|nr:carboxypeptidase-like regulatory domain-containing protein [Ignavibacteriota bacterium]